MEDFGMNRKFLSLTLAVIMVFTSLSFAFAADSGKLDVGNGGNYVVIPMSGSISGTITLGSGSVNKDMPASEHMASASKSKGTVIASVNGALFNAYYNKKTALTFPDNCARTYGAIIVNGQSVKGVGSTPMLAFTSDGKALIDRVKIDVRMTLRRKEKVGMWAVNDYYTDSTSIVLITPECGYSVPLQAGAVVVHVKNGIVDSVDDKNPAYADCLAGEQLVVYNSGAWANAKKYTLEPKKGNSAEITTSLTPDRTAGQADWDKVITGVGVSPWLLQGGKDVFDQNGTMEAKMGKDFTAQRTFAAVKADGTLMIGETSGTFANIITYLQGQGYVDAIALDGGSSSMLNVGGTYKQNAGRNLTNVIHIIDYGSAASLPKKTAAADIVTPDSWAVGFISTAEELGLIPDKFDMAAKQNITRAEFCQLAYNFVEKVLDPEELTGRLNTCGITYKDAEAAFTDISNDYHNVIVQSYRLGLVSGKGAGKFDPYACITRQEAAALLTNTAKVVGIEANGEAVEFADAASFANWAPTFIDFVARAGIMSGTTTGFNPNGYFNKEQAVITFVNLYSK